MIDLSEWNQKQKISLSVSSVGISPRLSHEVAFAMGFLNQKNPNSCSDKLGTVLGSILDLYLGASKPVPGISSLLGQTPAGKQDQLSLFEIGNVKFL